MEKIRLRIELINRVKPEGMEGYKRIRKSPVRIRSCVPDYFNRWEKENTVEDYRDGRQSFLRECERLSKDTPWLILFKDRYYQRFGCMLIGRFSLVGEEAYTADILIKLRNTLRS